MAKNFPRFELEINQTALKFLSGGITSYATRAFGDVVHSVWLANSESQFWSVGVTQRDLQFKFEVFSLTVRSLDDLKNETALRHRTESVDGVLEQAHPASTVQSLTLRPPTNFAPWPFEDWYTHILLRTDIIDETTEIQWPTMGSDPVIHSAIPPGASLSNASAACDVEVGFLFTGPGEQRLLVGVDWFPFAMTVTQNCTEMDDYISCCELVAQADYECLS